MEDQVEDEKKRKRLETRKRYRQKNREALNDKYKQYRLENKEKIKEKKKQYRLENGQKINEKNKKYRLENEEEISEKNKKYRLENNEKIKQYRLENKDRKKENTLKRKYGLTLEDYIKMLQEQNGSCAICFVKAEEQKNKVLVVDHNHLTGEVRSLLCSQCNVAIGLLKENQEVILRAAEYLKKFSAS